LVEEVQLALKYLNKYWKKPWSVTRKVRLESLKGKGENYSHYERRRLLWEMKNHRKRSALVPSEEGED
jgi:hypothetical protein